jgi:hypothetical protein
MYEAKSKEDLINSVNENMTHGELETIREVLIAIAYGMTSSIVEGTDETLGGDPMEISLSWSIAPGYEHDYSKIIVTTIDITERKKAEEKIAAMMGKGKTYAQAYAALSDREKGSHRAVWELLTKQLPASAASGQPPILIISDVVGKIGNWSVVETLLRTNFPPGTQLAKIAEGDILKKSKLIRALLGIP